MAIEFDLIEAYFKPLSKLLSVEDIGIGDDGAVLSIPKNHQLVIVTDTLVNGVHFPEDTQAYDIAWKAVAVNLSDLAAMGAKGSFFSLALTLPSSNQVWLKSFAEGLEAISDKFKISLIGGDITKGPLTITVTAQGWVPKRQAVLRSGVKFGDLICVTQTLGDGALGLKVVQKTLASVVLNESEVLSALESLNRPNPMLPIAELIRPLVNSAIDISDGLLADLGHILKQSNIKSLKKADKIDAQVFGAEINLEQLPLSEGVKHYLKETQDWSLVLAGGDDYQLCMTVPKENVYFLKEQSHFHGVKITVIGCITNTGKIECFEDGVLVKSALDAQSGYQHF